MFRKIEFWSFLVAIAALGLGFYYHPPFHSSTKGTGPAGTAQTVAKVRGHRWLGHPYPEHLRRPESSYGKLWGLDDANPEDKSLGQDRPEDLEP